ncbi:MAG TPA: CHAT domain-containing protein [Leptolyngbyaceae cyanobacterium]
MQSRHKFLSLVSATVLLSLVSFIAPREINPVNRMAGAQTPLTLPDPAPPPISTPLLSPINTSPSPALSPIELSAPSLSPINLSPSILPLPSIRNNTSGNVLSIEISCQEVVENPQQKLEACRKFLALHRKLNDKVGEGITLNNIGLIYREFGYYREALKFYQQALEIQKNGNNRGGEAATFNNIGLAYHELGEYPQALTFYQQALAIHKEVGNRVSEARTLNNLAELYRQLGQYSESLEFYQQALAIVNSTNDRANLGNILHNIGLLYEEQSEYLKALEYYQQSLAIRKKIADKLGEGTTLNNLGAVYDKLGQHSQALNSLQQALAILQEINNRPGISYTLDSIGTVYRSIGKYELALEAYQKALLIIKQIGNRGSERITLSNLGSVLEKQGQPELAIIFYKQSVNVTEVIRKDLHKLSREQQESYTKTVADTYRSLADLLLKQNRVLEAQQVIDLLKVQEIDDYLHNVRGNEVTSQGVELIPAEQKVAADYATLQDKAIQLGKELAQLRKIPEANRTPAQVERIPELVKAQEAIASEFNAFIRSPEVEAMIAAQSPTVREQTLSLRHLKNMQDNLQRLEQGAVLLYPLILEDRLELILTTPYSPPIHRTVTLKREELNRAIVELRATLQNPHSNPIIPGQKLYDWLIKPLEKDLIQVEAKTIIYAPDGQLRYVPLAALHDGKKWLVERFRINYITADSLTDFNTKPESKPHVLAAGFTSGNYSFQIGDRNFSFSGLPFAAREVENIVTAIPNSLKLLDRNFSRDATIPRLNDYNIVHMATHAAFVIGQPEDSFILFGNGDRVTLRDVENWSMTNVDLVVLSACETGLGGKLGNGEEILGFGYLFQEAGAKAAIASLWQVSDGGTQVLMERFYGELQKGNVTKAEALRQAQLALITNNNTALGLSRGIAVQPRTRDSLPPILASNLSHPYYWASFILIGNGL